MQSFSVSQQQQERSSFDDTFESLRKSLVAPKYLCFCIPLAWITVPEDPEAVKPRNSELSTVFLLLNYMIGSGIVVQAFVFREAGIIVTCFEYAAVAVMNYAGVHLIVRCAEEVQVFDFSETTTAILGPRGAVAVDVSIVIAGAGSLLSYVLIIGTLFQQVVGSCDGGYCNIGFLTVVCIYTLTAPLCLMRNFGHLAIASYFSIAVISATIMLVLVGGPQLGPVPGSYNMGSFVGAVSTVGDIVFALGYTTATFHAYNGMADKSVKGFSNAAALTTAAGAAMCFVTGLVGYISFGSDTMTNILENFKGAVGSTFKTFVIIHLLLYIPSDFVIMRQSLLKLFNVDVALLPNASFLLISFLLLTVIVFIGVMLQLFATSSNNLGIVVDITGGVAGSMLYFVIPALCAMTLFKEKSAHVYCQGCALLFCGVAIIALVIASNAI